MSADSRINIVLDVDTQGTEQIEATSARLAALGRAERSLGQDTNRLSGRMDELTGRMNSASGAMGKLNKANNLFIAHARKIMYLVIGLGIEFLAVTLALVSVNAAFAVGNAAVKLYNWGMQGLAGAVAAAGVAAITAAAAFTEFNAAAQAFRFKDGPGLGSAISQSADALRMLQVNSTLATYGITALNQAYMTFSKNAKLDPKAVKQLEMMADFGTGGNREKSMAASAEYISLLKKNKGFSSESTQLAKQIGPEFEKASKKYGSASSLLKALESGKLAKDAGVEGFGKTVNQTLMAQLKGYLTKAFVELSDAGRYLLEPVKKAFNSIFGGLTTAFRMVRGDLIRFGRGGLLSSLESLSEKTETFAVKLFREFLPAAAGWWKRTGDFFKAFVNEFNQARRSLDSMREGGSVVIDMFGKPLVQIFKRIGSGAQAFAQIAKENKTEFSEFGDALKRIVDGFFDIGNAVRKAFTAALPIISKIATVVGQVFETLAKVLNFMAMMGPIGATMAVGAVARFAMKGTRGARYERRMAKGVAGGMSSIFGGNMGSIRGNMAGGGGAGMVGSSSISAASAVVNAGTVVVNGRSGGGGRGRGTGPIQGNLGPGGGGGGGGGPLPGSGAPTAPGMGNYVPTRRLKDFGSRLMTNLFGPKYTGATGQSTKVGMRNRFMEFMSGGPARANAAKLQDISTNLAGHLQAGKSIKDFMDDNPDVDPGMIQAAMGKDGGKKPLTKSQARMRALKMKGSAMGGGMLAAVGTGMFLESGMGKKVFGDPDAQNSMHTGAMLMPFNPALGLGVGLAGAAINSKTTLGGAASGAGAGAMLAMSATGGPVAMLITAAIMATLGVWRSVVNRNKMARDGAKAVGKLKLMDTVLASVAGGIKDGTSEGGRKELASYGKFVDDFEGMNKRERAGALKTAVDSGVIDKTTAELMSGQGGYGEQAVGELKKQLKLHEDILNPMRRHYDDVMRGLQLATGKSADQLHKLAAEAGVNLYEDSLKLTDAIKGLGIGMKQTAAEINTALRDVAINATSHFDTYREGKEMEDALQSAEKTLTGGNVTTNTLIDFFQKNLDFEQLAAPDIPIENFLSRYDKFANGSIFQPGGQLGGVTPTAEFTGLSGRVLADEQKGIAGQLTTNIGQALADKNVGFESTAGGQNLMQTAVSGLLDKAKGGDFDSMLQLAKLEEGLKNGTLLGDAKTPAEIGKKLETALNLTSKTGSAVPHGARGLRGTELSEKPGAVGQALKTLTTGTFDADAKAQLIAAHGAGAVIVRDEILAAFNLANMSLSGVEQWWSNEPAWYSQTPSGLGGGAGGIPIGTLDRIGGAQVKWDGKNYRHLAGPDAGEIADAGDTSTSKALRATMGAHSRFNGMLPGKRMITSSWREHSLGSPSSDHVTGRAFDLTGDNLQQYAANVNGSGGFAEFHGVNGERHLHVVPPIGPMGDSSSPQNQVRRKNLVGAGSAGSASAGGDTFNITVMESVDAGATADAVVKKIVNMQKQARRRA